MPGSLNLGQIIWLLGDKMSKEQRGRLRGSTKLGCDDQDDDDDGDDDGVFAKRGRGA